MIFRSTSDLPFSVSALHCKSSEKYANIAYNQRHDRSNRHIRPPPFHQLAHSPHMNSIPIHNTPGTESIQPLNPPPLSRTDRTRGSGSSVLPHSPGPSAIAGRCRRSRAIVGDGGRLWAMAGVSGRCSARWQCLHGLPGLVSTSHDRSSAPSRHAITVDRGSTGVRTVAYMEARPSMGNTKRPCKGR